MNDRPAFDISSLLQGEEVLEESHDPTRTRPSPERAQSGYDYRRDSYQPAPMPEDNPPAPAEDAINPSHYRRHPSGIECIEVTRHMNFNTGNAIKYIWRYLDKDDPVENLKKAQWYLDDEIRRLEGKR
jgi:hypothetical protein